MQACGGCQLPTKKKAMFKMKQILKMNGTYLNIIKYMPVTSFFRMYHQKIGFPMKMSHFWCCSIFDSAVGVLKRNEPS